MEELQQLQSDDPGVRAAAAESLAEMGPDAQPAATALVQACRDDECVQQWAVAALEQLGPPPENQIGALQALISSPDPVVAYWSITLLGRAGQASLACQDDLATALNEASDDSVRERAAWALGKIGATSAEAAKALTAAASPGQPPRLTRLATQSLEQLSH